MEGPIESKEKKSWLDRILEHGTWFAVALIVGIAQIVSVDDPSVKGRLWDLEWGIFAFVSTCSLIAALVSLARGKETKQLRLQWRVKGRTNQLKVYWTRVDKYADYFVLSVAALLALCYTKPLILSLPDLAIENVEVLSENINSDDCSITRPELEVTVKNRGDAPAGGFRLGIESKVGCEPNEKECLYSMPPGKTEEFTFTLGTSGDESLVAVILQEADFAIKDKEPRNNSSHPIYIPPVCTPTPMPIPDPPIMGFTVLIPLPRPDDPRNLQSVWFEPGESMPVLVNRKSLLHIAAIVNPDFGEAEKALVFRWEPSAGEIDKEEKSRTVSYLTPDTPGSVSVTVDVSIGKTLIITKVINMRIE